MGQNPTIVQHREHTDSFRTCHLHCNLKLEPYAYIQYLNNRVVWLIVIEVTIA